jgi:glycosyltransferase involved in cell wall biosynthesis
MPRKIAFVINSIGYGGAERALYNILAHIGAHKADFDVHLITLDDHTEARSMPAYVNAHVLDCRGSLMRSLWQLDRCLARLGPALVVSFLVRANVASAIAARRLGIPHIACERMHLSSHLAGRYRGLKLWATRMMPRLAYRFPTIVLGVSTGVTEDLIARHGVARSRARTIYNPYDLEAIEQNALKAPEMPLPSRFIVAVGRLERSKNFGQLIEAYLRAGLPMALVILGEGPERSRLEHLVTTHNAQDRILLPGYARNPFAIVARADFFVSASLNEGFPNAMVEAMVLGKPVVATDCQSGPAEILAGVVRLGDLSITEAKYGILVPEGRVEALKDGIIRMAESETRRRYALQAKERAGEFGAAFISDQYWTLFDEVLRQKAPGHRTPPSRRRG